MDVAFDPRWFVHAGYTTGAQPRVPQGKYGTNHGDHGRPGTTRPRGDIKKRSDAKGYQGGVGRTGEGCKVEQRRVNDVLLLRDESLYLHCPVRKLLYVLVLPADDVVNALFLLRLKFDYSLA